ncbi:hypothetical protein BJ170DRAFT_681163 [Xylariales sp. AK1849]|nr:hypothetical protein BJ170DRAFT_681163 [Xylariales sp. AK1849]
MSGRESPSPERLAGPQQSDAPGSGKGTDNVNSDEKKGDLKDQLQNLSSNPKGALDDEVTKKFSKTSDPSESTK